MDDNENKKTPAVKTSKTPKNKVAAHAANYRTPVKTWEKTVTLGDGKEKVILFRKFKNGVVKSSLKAMFKVIRGRKVKIA